MQSNIQNQIANLEAQKQAAQRAEQARLDAETANRRQIADAEAEIRRLQWQETLQAFGQYVQTFNQHITAFNAARTALIAALDKGDLTEARALCKTITQAAKDAQDVEKQAMAFMQPHIRAAFAEARTAALKRGERESDAMAIGERAIRSLGNFDVFTKLPSLLAIVEGWVESIPESRDRQVRRGMAYALTGQFCDPYFNHILAAWVGLPMYGFDA